MASNRAERRRAEKIAKKKASESGASVDLLMNKASAHYKAGELSKTLTLLEKVLIHQPDRHDVIATAGLIAFDLKDYERSITHYKKAIALEPGDMKAQFALGLSLKSLGRFAEATAPFRQAVLLSKGAAEPLRTLIDVLWQLGESLEIPAYAAQLIKHEPHKTVHYMHQAMAHYHRGTPEKARALLAFDDLVEIHDLEAPEGYGDIASFNKALADFVANDPSMAVPDKNDPKYHNDDLHITRELTGPTLNDVSGPIRTLERMITDKVADYVQRKTKELDHIFLKNWPEKSYLTSWGTLLKGQGNLHAHIHIDGYLGMVYYPELPNEMRSDAANKGEDTSGYLELGRPQEDFPVKVETDIHLIQPKEGRLVIFPGYFFHRTVPFQSKDRRISIAFDVVAES